MPERLRQLARLTAKLGAAVTVDDVARVALSEALAVDGVIRAGLALSEGGGRELAFVSTDEGAIGPLGVRWCKIDALDDVPLVRTVLTGEPVWLDSPSDIEQRYPDLADRQRRLGTRSLATVPLVVDGGTVGGLMLAYERPVPRSQEQQAYLGAIAAQVAQAVKRGLAYQVHYSTSEQLQRSLMPHSLPDLPGLAIGSYYQPGGRNVDVGGDWFDVQELDDGSVAVALGDVMGKGLSAAIVMSEIRAAARAYALLDPDPASVLRRLDEVVTHLPGPDQVVTMLYGVITPDRSTLTLGIAGHPPPLLVAPSGRPRLLGDRIGPALGLGLDLGGVGSWPTLQVRLEDRTSVLFYSDGLVETRQQDLFLGIDRLRDRVAELDPRRRNPRELCARLSEQMTRGAAEDDVTVLAVTAAPQQRRAGHELPADASAPAEARQYVAGVLGEWSIEEDVIASALVCVSELVTNAVIHSGTTSSVSLEADEDYLLVRVQDRGGRGVVRRPEGLHPESISGRGLTVVEGLASAWNAEHSADGTTVWFELPLRPRADSSARRYGQDARDY